MTFTTCPAIDKSWSCARKASCSTPRQGGRGRDTNIDFKGVPVLYLPWVSFPLGTSARAVFCFQRSATPRSGVVLAVSRTTGTSRRTWTSRPSRSITPDAASMSAVIPLSRAGLQGELHWHYLPHDYVFGDSRSASAAQTRHRAARQFTLLRRRRRTSAIAVFPGLLARPRRHQHGLRRAARHALLS